jgi:hypothetical protein
MSTIFITNGDRTMMEVKPWYQSRTVWASVVAMLAAFCSLVGEPADAFADPALVDAALSVVTAVSGFVALIGRLVARSRIG